MAKPPRQQAAPPRFLMYTRALALIPELLEVCDICHIYDNSDMPFRIFKKRKDAYFYWENEFWDKAAIARLTGYAIP